MNTGLALKKIRFDKGLSQVSVAKKAKITQTYLSMIESGKKENPSKKVIQSLCKIYKVPMAVVVWYSLEESDVHQSKREIFKQLRQPMYELIKEFIK